MTRGGREEFEEAKANQRQLPPKQSPCRSMIAKVNAKVERDLRARLEKMEEERGYAPVHAYLISGQRARGWYSGVFRTAEDTLRARTIAFRGGSASQAPRATSGGQLASAAWVQQ
jgi:hypothetical protein